MLPRQLTSSLKLRQSSNLCTKKTNKLLY